MKKARIYTLTLILFATAAGFIVLRYNGNEKTGYALQERVGPSAHSKEWQVTRSYGASLVQTLKEKPGDTKASLALAVLFIQESRVTGNHVYYDKAAMSCVNEVLKKDSSNFDGLTYKALIYLSQHHFSDGLAVAKKAQAINPYNAFIYGLLVDGYTEMGRYDSAVVNADRMSSIRPDIRSYSRISYLREIHGSYAGAIAAMKMAVDAGAPGDEGTEWSRVQLGHLYENTGDLRSAEMHYRIALDERAGYAPAYAGLARLAMAAKDYRAAIGFYRTADSCLADYSFKEEMAEAFKLSGQPLRADSIDRLVVEAMTRDAQSGRSDENIGHYADRELAYAWLKLNDYDKALDHALLEYNRRPDNIDVNEAVAWVYYCKGEYAKALPFAQTALRTGSRNPNLLCHVGLIFAANGKKTVASSTLKAALSDNPNIPEALQAQSRQMLNTL